MKLAWLTDIHLNFIDDVTRQKFYQEIISTKCDAILLSGDIAEAPSVAGILTEMANFINKPIYFVLGNHDYYRGQINEVRNVMTAITNENDKLFWLPASGIQKLNGDILIIGQDGWADGRLGDYHNSRVALNDSRIISDLFQEKILGKYQLLKKMQELADADASQLQEDLVKSISQNPKNVIVLTHVPPFKECCLHMGEISNDDWLPYFSSQVTGGVLMTVAKQNPGIDFLVLCGHTHSKAKHQPIHNLIIEVGDAEYCQPTIQKILTL